ncbi:MAG: alpha-glucosidase [Eubacteriales bacterium]|nr:alpha-glucosidase [Eubacteriales bacterium]
MINGKSRVKDVYASPIGRDVIDKILLQLDRSNRLIINPLVSNLRMSRVEKLTRKQLDAAFWETFYWLLNLEPDRPSESHPNPSWTWWKDAVFYQIYPRSFADSNADGIGDINGIRSKLDYLQSLGVDALWLSPIYDSPNDDNGYDIRDYKAIMAEMGTMEDFDLLLEEVHTRGMRLIMDLVVNHTSDEHAWFQEALHDPKSPYRSYYFFRPGAAGLPNNWRSFFSGPAWRYYPEQDVYTLHLFSEKQPDLNWDHEPMRKDIAEMVRWWLDKGVDGFRLDVINYISKREGLPDGDDTVRDLITFGGIENYYYGPNLNKYLKELRREAFDPYNAFSVGETPGIGLEMGRLLSGEDRKELDLVFNFDQLESPGKWKYDNYLYDLNYLKKYYIKYHTRLSDNDWMSVFWENHDNPRMVSKVNPDPKHRRTLSKLLLVWLLTMRGTAFVYQGQELGEVNQKFRSIGDVRDVEAINLYAELSAEQGEDAAWATILAGSRDHSRVPMNWDETLGNGFSTTEPWLPRPERDNGWSVASQEEDPNSVLNDFRNLIALRKQHPALRRGSITFIKEKKRDYLAYVREWEGEKILVEFNLCDLSPMRSQASAGDKLLYTNMKQSEKDTTSRRKLLPYEAAIYLCE